MRLPTSLLWAVLALAPGMAAAAAPLLEVVYPAPESAADVRFRDLIELLDAALARTVADSGPYRLRPGARPMTEARYLLELEQGTGAVTVVWSSTSADRERRLRPIRIPVNKGIIGYRIALIDARLQARIDRVQTLADLRQLRVGQGIGWGDVAVYRAAGIPVVSARYEQLFPMLLHGRFHLFFRGANEVLGELAAQRGRWPGLAVERGLLLYYPWPYYFFCSRRDEALAQRLETGLQRLRADGGFDALFWKYHRDELLQLDLHRRRLIRLDNPLLPPATPLHEPGLWFDPTRDRIPPAQGR